MQSRVSPSSPPVWIHFAPQVARVVDCSGGVDPQLHYRCEELRDQPLRVLADPGDWQDPAGVWRALCEGREISERPLRVLTREGAPRLMQAHAVVLEGLGEPVGLLQLQDIDQRWPQQAAGERDRQRLQALAYELTLAEARDRERLAQALHDDLGQLLAVAQLRLAECQNGAQGGPALAEVRELLAQASRATRAASFELHSPLLQQLGLQAAIEGLADRLRQAGLRVDCHGRLERLPLADAVQAVLLRVVRELLANVRKHAQATQVALHLRADARRLRIAVLDDGLGLSRASRSGFGLRSAEAQMQSLGGLLSVRRRPGGGTWAQLVLPLQTPLRGPA
jgi:signal transduction histidine kinase